MSTNGSLVTVAHLDTNGVVTLSRVEQDAVFDYIRHAVSYEPAPHASRPALVEVVRMNDALEGWVNEEGKFYLERARKEHRVWRNMAATALCIANRVLQPADFIAGPMVLTGPTDQNDRTVSLTDEQIDEICQVSGLPVVDMR